MINYGDEVNGISTIYWTYFISGHVCWSNILASGREIRSQTYIMEHTCIFSEQLNMGSFLGYNGISNILLSLLPS